MRSILPALARVLCVAPLLGALAAKCELDCSLNGVEIVAKDGTCTCVRSHPPVSCIIYHE